MPELQDHDSDATAAGQPMELGAPSRPGSGLGRLIGVVVATLIVGGAWFLLRKPAVPDLETSSFAEVFAFLGHARGFESMPYAHQHAFVEQMKARWRDDATQRALKTYLDGASKAEADAFRDAMEPFIFRWLVDQARSYARLPREDRIKFLIEFDQSVRDDKNWISGFGDPEKNLTSRIGELIPSSSEAMLEVWMKRTSPDERSLLEAMHEDYKSRPVQEQLRRAQESRTAADD